MKFEVGQYWLTRNDSIAKLEHIYVGAVYAVKGQIINSSKLVDWYNDGSVVLYRKDPHDLIKQISKEENPEYFL